jgi:hypothetical protein
MTDSLTALIGNCGVMEFKCAVAAWRSASGKKGEK